MIKEMQNKINYKNLNLEVIPIPVLLLDRDGLVYYSNNACQDFLYQSSKSLIAKSIFDTLRCGGTLKTLLNTVYDNEASASAYGIDMVILNHGEFHGDIIINPLPETDLAITIIWPKNNNSDITDDLAESEKSRSFGQIGRALAHEVKNPLAGIRGAAQLLMLDASSDQKPLAKLIIDETDRVHRLIDRVESLGVDNPIDLVPLNIHTIIDRVAQLAENGFANELHISRQYDVSLPMVLGEPDMLTQIFLNLAKNAAEAANEKGTSGRIVFSTAYKHGHKKRNKDKDKPLLPIEVTISDNGYGISEELRNVIFDPFVTTKSEGNGLGLALVKKMVTSLGGTVDFETQPGKTSFKVRLQLANVKKGDNE